jgi:hypothetical protein
MYYKNINDRVVFSTCDVIQLDNGQWVSNPSEEQILAAGWQEYVSPAVTPQPQLEPEYEDIIEAVKKMLQSSVNTLSDEQALEVAALFPTWSSKMGTQVNAGERCWYDGTLYKVIQSHTVQDSWTPDVSASLFTPVSIEEWPEFVQPTGAQDAYNTGDKVTFDSKHYICKMDNCTWSPDAYPAAWELQN